LKGEGKGKGLGGSPRSWWVPECIRNDKVGKKIKGKKRENSQKGKQKKKGKRKRESLSCLKKIGGGVESRPSGGSLGVQMGVTGKGEPWGGVKSSSTKHKLGTF